MLIISLQYEAAELAASFCWNLCALEAAHVGLRSAIVDVLAGGEGGAFVLEGGGGGVVVALLLLLGVELAVVGAADK